MKSFLAGALILGSILGLLFIYHPEESHKFGREHTQFLKNLQTIVSEINRDKQASWVAGENQRWENMSLQVIKSQMGALREPSGLNLPQVDNVMSDIPASYDPRTRYPNCQSLKEVRDQANCGSCWAFSAAEVMSDRVCIASKETRQDRISTQDILTCCTTCGNGCNGGWPEMAFNWYLTTGVVTGDLHGDDSWCQSYSLPPCDHHTIGQYNPCQATVSTPKCDKSCSKQYWRSYKEDKQFAETAYNIQNDEAAIMTEIYNNGPVSAAFTVYEDFLTYQSGVYHHVSGGALGGHAVKIIGWGTEVGINYWLVVNSWNQDWGDNGLFKILRGTDECGIESEISAALPQLA